MTRRWRAAFRSVHQFEDRRVVSVDAVPVMQVAFGCGSIVDFLMYVGELSRLLLVEEL